MNPEEILNQVFPVEGSPPIDDTLQQEIDRLRARRDELLAEAARIGWFGRLLGIHQERQSLANHYAYQLEQLQQPK